MQQSTDAFRLKINGVISVEVDGNTVYHLRHYIGLGIVTLCCGVGFGIFSIGN